MNNKEFEYKILIKNINNDLSYLREKLPAAINIKSFGRKRALIQFASEINAQNALEELQNNFKGTKTIASLLNKTKCTQLKNHEKNTKIRKCSKYTQTKLSGESSSYSSNICAAKTPTIYDEPPPAHLKYAYPKATIDIVDAISIALMTNTQFYTQVLHLMNRMNLEPPFGPKKSEIKLPGRPKDFATQTDEAIVERIVETQKPQSSSSESEMEDESPRPLTLHEMPKQLEFKKEHIKIKARQLLQSACRQTPAIAKNPRKYNEIKECFEEIKVKRAKIVLNVPIKKIEKNLKSNASSSCQQPEECCFVPPSDLSTQQLSSEKMSELPIYKNYMAGEPSNKLYIKNLAKNITTDDLFALYGRFVKSKTEMDVRVMQQGRMKGQAFVTFQGNDIDNQKIANDALHATNGFILREKPMIVCFGKKTYNTL